MRDRKTLKDYFRLSRELILGLHLETRMKTKREDRRKNLKGQRDIKEGLEEYYDE